MATFKALTAFREARAELLNYKLNRFPHGLTVRVNHSRYSGLGTAVDSSDCPPDQVAVLLENGNTWFYPIEHVEPR